MPELFLPRAAKVGGRIHVGGSIVVVDDQEFARVLAAGLGRAATELDAPPPPPPPEPSPDPLAPPAPIPVGVVMSAEHLISLLVERVYRLEELVADLRRERH